MLLLAISCSHGHVCDKLQAYQDALINEVDSGTEIDSPDEEDDDLKGGEEKVDEDKEKVE